MDAVPTFYLYGEPHRAARADFVHVESLEERSRPAGWRIKPHAHRDLNHLILVAQGGGAMSAETMRHRFAAPCLLPVPSRTVHGFAWTPDTSGMVITLNDGLRDALLARDGQAASLFAEPGPLPVSAEAAAQIADDARALMRELGWAAPGHGLAVEARLLGIVVTALRSRLAWAAQAAHRPGRHAGLVAQYRALVDSRFRLREQIGAYAERLSVSETTLRTACARIARASPGDILNDRMLLEAKRALCYSNGSIAQIAYALGFADPAYFTRLFTRLAGQSPRAFRTRTLAALPPETGLAP
jgi:AraC family transcriptional regulator, transcriptional activator of pobA